MTSETDSKLSSDEAPGPKRSIFVLIVDDSPVDVALMISMLRSNGFSVTFERVEDPDRFQECIATKPYDAILCDHNLRSWVGMDALKILRQSSEDVPFIVVTGTLGDERAVEYLKQGASDYVLKDHLERLPLAIDRALREQAHRSETARFQRMIRSSKEEWEKTFDAIPDSVMILDNELRIKRANRATFTLLGLKEADVVGAQCFTIAHADGCQPLECPFRKTMLSGHEQESEITETKFGKILSDRTIPIKDANGNLEGVVHVIRDITGRKRIEEELIQSRKMEAIGRLAGGIAHDLNNILGIIVGYSDLIQERLPGAEGVVIRQLSEIRKAAHRATAITQQLLAFSRKQVMQLQVVTLNDIVADVAKMLGSLLGENIELTLKTIEDPGNVRVDPVQLQQVLINLAINARDAMPNGGQLTIATTNIDYPDVQHAAFGQTIPAGRYCRITISDTGIGMDEETLSHVFEPFFTTKEKGKGTGFGLSIVYGIVKQSGGHLVVSSEPGRGATFKIYLPRVAEQPNKILQIPSILPAKASSGTILVVEDQDALAEMVCTVLQSSGYDVLRGSNGQDALRLARNYKGSIRLMLTDVILRGKMDGLELARRLCKLRPDTKVMFMSGFSDALNKANATTGFKLLEKPFTNAVLRATVREVLEGTIQEENTVPIRASGLP